MTAYFRNLKLWALGLGRLRELDYKPGWGPVLFLIPYLTTYLAGTLVGYGVVSLSRAWYERREISRLAHIMTRAMDWLVPGRHGAETGGWLWDSVNLRKMP